MPWYIQSYLLIYALVLLVNIYVWFKERGNFLMFIYEMLAGSVIIFLTAAYWMPELESYINIFSGIAFLAIAAFDFYISVLADKETMEKLVPTSSISDKEMEVSKMISVVFTAPAYVIGALLFIDILRK